METTLIHWSQALSVGLAQCFVSTLWQGTALSVLVGIGLWATPRTNASTRFAIWLTAFLLLALLPLGAFAPHFGAASPTVAVAGISAEHVHFNLDPRWAWAIALLWACGSLYHAASLARSGFRLRSLLDISTLVEAGELDAEVRAALLLSSKQVQLRLSDRVNAPCAVGFFHPSIFIPRWLWTRLTSDELRQIVVHEGAHLRRRDDWTNLLQKFALTLFPLNAALYWIERRLCLEREIACDDAVLATTLSPAKYAACLAGLAEKKMLRQTASLAPGAWSHQSELLLRVQGILNRNRNASTQVAGSVAAGFIAAAAGGAFFLAQSPQLVSFVAPQAVEYGATGQFKANLVTPNLNSYLAESNRAAFHHTASHAAATTAVSTSFEVPAVNHSAVRRPIARMTLSKPPVQPVISPSQPSLYQEVGILQSPATGRTWVVLSVWRPTPGQQPSTGIKGNAANGTSSPASSSAASAIQTGWLLIRI